MKGEYVENQEHHHHQQHTMFSKFPPPHLHQQQQPPPKFTHFPLHPFPNFKDSEEADSATTTSLTPPPPSSKKPKTTSTSEDGATVEVSRRPRGRPPGSKNKPKPPVVITREPDQPTMSPYILELPPSSDIIHSLTLFTRRHNLGMCVLSASGAVSNVTLKQPSTAAPGATVTFHGRFDILSLSAVILLQTDGRFAFTISLAGPQGQIVGGKVVGPLVASGVVYVVATSFNSPTYHRLPLEEQDLIQNPSAGAADGQSSSPVSGGADVSGNSGGGNGMGGIYSCHMGSTTSDVIWAPTARPPPPPPPY